MADSSYYAGKKFGRLTAIRELDKDRTNRVFLFSCECGKEKAIQLKRVVSGKTKSCGCYRIEVTRERATKHGMKAHPLYNTWHHMRRRCLYANHPSFKNYGGRGITICKEWDDFACFAKWADDHGGYTGLEIDRIDNNGPYSPDNCRWVTRTGNNRNKRNNVLVTTGQKQVCLAEAAEEFGINYFTVHARIRRGKTPEQAIGLI